MKTCQTFTLVGSLLLALFFLPEAFAQTKSTVIQLEHPDLIDESYFEGGIESICDLVDGMEGHPGMIYYSHSPSDDSFGADKPVLVFVHGYTSDASWWWSREVQMYHTVYAAGYRSAYLTLYSNRSIWENGVMLSGMLKEITEKYGTEKVVVIGHSKGGLDADVALVHRGAYKYVDRVITISAPHWGTTLADLAQVEEIKALHWLSDQMCMANTATETMTLGYASWFRKITDNHPNNKFVDFRTIGGWGYDSSGPGTMLLLGKFLDATGGDCSTGGNDGVVAYYSSKRPGSCVLFDGCDLATSQEVNGDPRGYYDHLSITYSQNMWHHIEEQLPTGSSDKVACSGNLESDGYNPYENIKSRSILLSGDQGRRSFYIEKGVQDVQIAFKQLRKSGEISVIYPDGRKIKAEKGISRDLLSFDKNIRLSNTVEGFYKIVSDAPYVAVATMGSNAVEASLDMGLQGSKVTFLPRETINFELSFAKNGSPKKGDSATGKVTLITDLDGNSIENGESHTLHFDQNGLNLIAKVNQPLTPGVYSLRIETKSGKSTRSFIRSFAVADPATSHKSNDLMNGGKSFEMGAPYPNPFSNETSVTFTTQMGGDFTLNVYDIVGKKVHQIIEKDLAKGSHTIKWESLQNFEKGVYFLELSNGTEREVKRVILK